MAKKELAPELLLSNENFLIDIKEGLAQVKKGGMFGLIDNAGVQITPCVFSSGEVFRESQNDFLRLKNESE